MAGSYSFSQVPVADIPRSSFNRTHGHKTTFDSGFLIPFYVDEALPGDTFRVSASLFARLATPKVPFMDNLHLDVFFFAVPNRLLWDNWQKFMGEQTNPGDSTDYSVPVVRAKSDAGFAPLTMGDYFGLPTGVPSVEACAFPFRAYNLIYNEWFRDENLCNSIPVMRGDGPDLETDGYYVLRRRGKRHDYFTSCLPWPQKGPGVELPLGTTAPVTPVSASAGPTFFRASGSIPGGAKQLQVGGTPLVESSINPVGINAMMASGLDTLVWANPNLQVDLSAATSATINSLRQAFQVQKLLERDARGGTRYTEILRAHFGVVSPDARLQRPEYLGGGSVPISVNPVTQTSGTARDPATGYTGTPQGNLAAYGVAGAQGLGFSKSFVEHSVILGLVMVRADLSYQQGMSRMWNRRTRYDFYWPAFSHLGEQAVLNKEIYCDGTAADDSVFGYQERWAEYRYFPSKITGAFRSNYKSSPGLPQPDSLDYWHLAQNFAGAPTLSPTFIEENPPVERVVAVTSEPQFLFDSHIRVQSVRPMPTYSVPGYIDHF